MARRTTIKDVAQAAGVSVATVNRVLAGAGNVRPETARAVAEAAGRIGYHATNLIGMRADPQLPRLRLGFLLNKRRQEFYQNFAAALEQATGACQGAHCMCELVFAHSQAPADVAAEIRALGAQVDVLAATAVNHPAIDAAVSDLADSGVRVFSLLSDFAQGQRISYFGLNNIKVGRGAAAMLSQAARRPGKMAIFVGGHRWQGHELRETGFRGYFREYPGGFEVLDPLVNLETRQVTYEATLNLLERHRDIAGIYVAGGGMEGAIAALREARPPGDIAMVVNELTRESRFAMTDGYVNLINATPLAELSAGLVDKMVRAVQAPETVAGQNFLDPVLHLPEFF